MHHTAPGAALWAIFREVFGVSERLEKEIGSLSLDAQNSRIRYHRSLENLASRLALRFLLGRCALAALTLGAVASVSVQTVFPAHW